MKPILAVFDGKVFVPQGEVHLPKGARAIITPEEVGQPFWNGWKPPDAADRERFRQELQAYIDEHLPGTEISEELLSIVGICPPLTDEEIKEEYYMHFLEREDVEDTD